MIGGTYKITPELTAYAGYSEANRAPTPLELACADPARPCLIAAFLIADPPLKQVVSRTVEAGFRGTKELNIGTLGWKVGAFRATNADDILAIPSPELQGFGYFQNVGRTRRQGIEAQVNLTSKTLQLYASYALVDARFLDALQVGSNSPFADDDGNVQIVPGNRIPAIPRNRVKFGMDYSITDAFKVGGDALFVSNQYFVGDESNQSRGCQAMPFSISTPRIRSTRCSRSMGAWTTSSTIAMRPTAPSSIRTTCPISPMAARPSPTRVRSARRGRAPFTQA